MKAVNSSFCLTCPALSRSLPLYLSLSSSIRSLNLAHSIDTSRSGRRRRSSSAAYRLLCFVCNAELSIEPNFWLKCIPLGLHPTTCPRYILSSLCSLFFLYLSEAVIYLYLFISIYIYLSVCLSNSLSMYLCRSRRITTFFFLYFLILF